MQEKQNKNVSTSNNSSNKRTENYSNTNQTQSKVRAATSHSIIRG